MDGLDDTMKSVEAPWKLPDAINSRTRELLAYPDQGGKLPRDPLDGLDRRLTAQEALRVRKISCRRPVVLCSTCLNELLFTGSAGATRTCSHTCCSKQCPEFLLEGMGPSNRH